MEPISSEEDLKKVKVVYLKCLDDNGKLITVAGELDHKEGDCFLINVYGIDKKEGKKCIAGTCLVPLNKLFKLG